jgi:hypothetical protein
MRATAFSCGWRLSDLYVFTGIDSVECTGIYNWPAESKKKDDMLTFHVVCKTAQVFNLLMIVWEERLTRIGT